MRYARLDEMGLVVNVEEWNEGEAPEGLVALEDAEISDRWDGTALIKAPAPEIEHPPTPADPVAKLAAFLAANPDVAALVDHG